MRSWVGWAIFVGVAIFAGFVLLFWRIGLFDIPETDPGAKAFAAVLGLVGVALTELIAFVALILKHSFDERTAALAQQAEYRLRMETAIRAVGLMGTPKGEEAAASQKAGALMALSDLGNVEFSLALLALIWSSDPEFPTDAGVRVIDAGLRADSQQAQRDAATLLVSNADRLSGDLGVAWPQSWTYRWPKDALPVVRERMVEAMGAALIAVLSKGDRGRFSETDPRRGSVSFLFVLLTIVLQQDETPRVRAAAGALLRHLGPLYGPRVVLFGPDGDIDIAEAVKIADEEVRKAEATGRISTKAMDASNRLAALVPPRSSMTEQGTAGPAPRDAPPSPGSPTNTAA